MNGTKALGKVNSRAVPAIKGIVNYFGFATAGKRKAAACLSTLPRERIGFPNSLGYKQARKGAVSRKRARAEGGGVIATFQLPSVGRIGYA